MSTETIEILLATYNAERYVAGGRASSAPARLAHQMASGAWKKGLRCKLDQVDIALRYHEPAEEDAAAATDGAAR